jgi:hypothetical protein
MYKTELGVLGIRKYSSDIQLLDMQLHYDQELIHNTYKTLGTQGLQAYQRYLVLDYFFVIFLYIIMFSISLKISSNQFIRNVLIGLATAKAVFDIIENTLLILLIKKYPAVDSLISTICSWSTTLKFVALILWLVVVIVWMIIQLI